MRINHEKITKYSNRTVAIVSGALLLTDVFMHATGNPPVLAVMTGTSVNDAINEADVIDFSTTLPIEIATFTATLPKALKDAGAHFSKNLNRALYTVAALGQTPDIIKGVVWFKDAFNATYHKWSPDNDVKGFFAAAFACASTAAGIYFIAKFSNAKDDPKVAARKQKEENLRVASYNRQLMDQQRGQTSGQENTL
jgi:hypothetical protein